MGRLILEYQNWREYKPDDEAEIAAAFGFSLMPEEDRRAGKKPDHNQTFWCEVRLSRDLAARGRWPDLSKAEKVKAMFCYARDRIQESGRKVRQAPMFWTATSPLADGPTWDLVAESFPKKVAPVVFEPEPEKAASLSEARKAAGLLK